MTPTHDVPSIQALDAMEKSFYGYGVRRWLWGNDTMPLRISPSVRTLRWKSCSSVASTQAATLGAGVALMSSEMTFCIDWERRSQVQRSAIIGSSLKIDTGSCQRRISKELRQTLWLCGPVSQPFELFDRYDHHCLFALARDHLRSAFPCPAKYFAELRLGGLQLPPLRRRCTLPT